MKVVIDVATKPSGREFTFTFESKNPIMSKEQSNAIIDIFKMAAEMIGDVLDVESIKITSRN